jgi:hypothetical protein
MLTALGLCGLVVSLGCSHTGGKCDCGPQPGDAVTYAPFNHAPAPLAGTYEPIPAPVGAPAPAVVVPAPLPR